MLAFAVLITAFDLRSAQAEDSVALPTVRWRRSPRLLTVHVEPAEGTHLTSDLPLRALVFDDTFAVAERNAPLPDREGASARLQFPIFPQQAPDGWELRVDGGVCSDRGDLCVPFNLVTRVPRRGPPSARLETEPGRGPADVFESPRRPRSTPRSPPTGEGSRPAWFDAAKSGGVDAAFADARSRGTAVLADFFAVWCPPCDLLRDEFLHAPHRQELLSKFTLLRLDADSPASFPLKDRYKVGGYPTVLVIGSDGELLDRIVGWPGDAPLAQRLEPHSEPTSLLRLRELFDAAASGSPERQQLGLALSGRLATAGSAAEAWDVLVDGGEPTEESPPEVIEWAAELATQLERPDATGLVVLRASLPGPLDERVVAVLAAGDAIRESDRKDADAAADSYLAARRPALLDELLAMAGASILWTADGSGADVTRRLAGGPDDQWRIVDAAYSLAGWSAPTDEARDLYAIGASSALIGILQRVGRTPLGPPDLELTIGLRPTIGAVTPDQMEILRGNEGRYHDLVSLLVKADLLDPAEDYLRRLVATFPDAFTWHHRYAGFLRDHRSAEEALESADLALANAYGDNALRAVRRKAEILRELGRPEEALVLVQAALETPEPEQADVRTHRYRKALTDLATQIGHETP
jgi:thiol-disulfide isomerase/thioredoxin/tetratricopeptide (TPR) repeat protein